MPDAGILATVMLLVGLFLLGLEFFIPSFGMILVMAILSLVVSLWSAWKAWWGVSPYFFWTYIVVLTAGIPGSLMGAIALIQRTSLGNRIILNPGPAPEPAATGLEDLVGQHGYAQGLMTPGGIVIINNERHHAESVGMLVEPNTKVLVVAIKGNRVVVRPLTPAEESESASSDQQSRDSENAQDSRETQSDLAAQISERTSDFKPGGEPTKPNPLDFDIPEDYTGKS